MAADQTYLRQMGAFRRISGGLLALVFALSGLFLAVIVLIIGALNVAPLRHALLDQAVRLVESEDMRVEIGDIGGSWPRHLVLEELRLHDAEGEWLALARLELDWQPLELWRGRALVERLASEGLFVRRAPAGGEGETESEFVLPVLPIDIEIERFHLAATQLGEDIAGQDVAFDAAGAVAFTRGGGSLTLEAARTDGVTGAVSLALTYLPAGQNGSLSVSIEDGEPGRPGIAAPLLDIDGLERLVLTANGTMREGLVTGGAALDGGRAIGLDLDLHGGLARGTHLDAALAARGDIVARELDFAGAPKEVRAEVRLTPLRRGAYRVDLATLRAGELDLSGNATATPQAGGDWALDGAGDIAGAHHLVLPEAEALLARAGWRIAGTINDTFDAAQIDEAELSTSAGTARFAGRLSFAEAFVLTGEGSAGISDLRPVGELLGQPMQGTANLRFEDISISGDTGQMDIAIETSAVATGNAELDALLAEGFTGTARAGFGGGNAVVVTGLSARAGSRLDLTGNFTLAESGAMQGEAKAAMAEIGAIAGETARGALSASARIEGTLEQPTLALNATLARGSLAGFDAREAVLNLDLTQGRGPLVFRLGGTDGTATLRSSIELPDEGGARFDPIDLNLFGARLAGEVAVSPEGIAQGGLSGSRVALEPLGRLAGIALDGRADIELALADNEGRQDASLTLASRRIDIEITEPATLDHVTLEAQLADLTGTGSVDARFEAESGASGNSRFTKVEVLARGPLDDIAISAAIEGERLTINAEALSFAIEGRVTPSLVMLSRLDAVVGGASAELGSPLEMELRDGITRLRALDMRFTGPEGEGSLGGSFAMRPRSAQASLALERLPLELVSPFLPFAVIGGTGSGTLELDTNREAGEVRLRFDKAVLAEAGLDIRPAFDATLDAEWAGRRLSLTAEALGVSETPFRLTASLPLIRDPAGAFPVLPERGPIEALLTWKGPMASLMALTDLPGQRLTGDAEIALTTDGDISSPQVSGHARLANGTFENYETGTLMRDLAINIEGQRSELLSFSMNARDHANGRVDAEGTLSLAAGANPAVSIRARFDNMRMVSRRDLVLGVEGDLSLTGPSLPPNLEAPLKLEGTLVTTEARYLIPQRLPGGVSTIDVIIVQGAEEADAADLAEDARPLPLELDVTLRIGNPPARVAGRGVDSLWTGSVHVTGLAEDPVVRGTLTAERGTLDFAGKTFTLSRGRGIFAGERPIDPRLDVALDYARSDFSATVAISGRGSSPSIELDSSPSLPRDEIISRILFERGTGELTAFEAAQLANTAAELSGGGIGGFGILSQIQDSLGLDVLRVDQGASGGTTVSAGRYLREGFYVGVEQGALASDSSVKVEIDVTSNISVETKIGNDASSNVGVNWKWDY
ncbi:MAG: translocation/assembly module TamB domain-containing protein [Parvibaculum sp.]|nr:translocation/assembly module TamB domain-containing protein [Parvibaculum sp.]